MRSPAARTVPSGHSSHVPVSVTWRFSTQAHDVSLPEASSPASFADPWGRRCLIEHALVRTRERRARRVGRARDPRASRFPSSATHSFAATRWFSPFAERPGPGGVAPASLVGLPRTARTRNARRALVRAASVATQKVSSPRRRPLQRWSTRGDLRALVCVRGDSRAYVRRTVSLREYRPRRWCAGRAHSHTRAVDPLIGGAAAPSTRVLAGVVSRRVGAARLAVDTLTVRAGPCRTRSAANVSARWRRAAALTVPTDGDARDRPRARSRAHNGVADRLAPLASSPALTVPGGQARTDYRSTPVVGTANEIQKVSSPDASSPALIAQPGVVRFSTR